MKRRIAQPGHRHTQRKHQKRLAGGEDQCAERKQRECAKQHRHSADPVDEESGG